jgi:hypothetical protein
VPRADGPLSVFEETPGERVHSRWQFIRVPADAEVLVVAASPGNCCVGCRPRAVDLGLLERRTAPHFLGLADELLHPLDGVRE